MSGTGHPDPGHCWTPGRVPSRSRLSEFLSLASSRRPQTRQAGAGGLAEELGLWGLGWALVVE